MSYANLRENKSVRQQLQGVCLSYANLRKTSSFRECGNLCKPQEKKFRALQLQGCVFISRKPTENKQLRGVWYLTQASGKTTTNVRRNFIGGVVYYANLRKTSSFGVSGILCKPQGKKTTFVRRSFMRVRYLTQTSGKQAAFGGVVSYANFKNQPCACALASNIRGCRVSTEPTKNKQLQGVCVYLLQNLRKTSS